MKKTALLSAGLLAATCMVSCDESVTTTGSSLVQDEVEIVIDSTYTVSGHAVRNDFVPSRTVLQLLGAIDAKGYGALNSDVVCQYMPAATIDTVNVKPDYVDSVKLVLSMYKNGFAGDSIVPMGITVYPLVKALPSPIYSDFNPAGYYDSANPIGSVTYSGLIDGAAGVSADESGNIYKDIYVKLPNEIGRSLITQYDTDPSVFETPQAFAKWFPGLYIANSFGSGRVTRVVRNMINVYYHTVSKIEGTTRDTIIDKSKTYLAVTPEIISNNNISYTMADDLRQMANAGESLLVGPIGYEVEFKFPASEIISRYKAQSGSLSVINSLSFSIPVKEIENDYGLTPPPYVLLVKKKDKEKFFSGTQINDDISSFYASYNSTTKSYTFSSMREYIVDIMERGDVDAEDEEFVICPALVSFYVNSSSSNSWWGYGYGYGSTSSTVSSITPYVTEPVMATLDFDKAKIKFTFSKQTLGGK
ncbi:MAG: DUF4270 domain-containing protein [Staphylococcus sp.]|nr:DUF4270 domain-containing protein [Staphylococcus sp.]